MFSAMNILILKKYLIKSLFFKKEKEKKIMIKNKNILIVGAGGFIGGHLVKKLLNAGNQIVTSDIKPKEYWFQDFEEAKNFYSMDMKDISNCRKLQKTLIMYLRHVMGGMIYRINTKDVCNQFQPLQTS